MKKERKQKINLT